MTWNRYSLDLEAGSSQYAYVADNAALSITSDMTIESWVKVESAPSSGAQMVIAGKYDATGNNRDYAFTYFNDGGTLKLRFLNCVDGTSGNLKAVVVTQTLTTATWYHVAVAYDASAGSADFYVNGSQVGTTQTGLATSIHDGTGNFSIGAFGAGTSYFDGLISNARIFSDIRTITEIQDNMYSILTGTSNNLVGSWFNDANDYNDDAGSNNLTSSGSPVFSTNVPWTGANTTDWSKYWIKSDDTKVSGSSDHTDIPLLIKDGNLSSAVYSGANADGSDLRFTTDDTGTTEVPFEIVSFTPGSSSCEIWIKYPTLSYNTNSDLYVWYGNSSAVAYDANAPFGSQAVWSDYAATWHLNEASGTRASSTGNNTLADGNTVLSATGKIGTSADFEKTNSEYLSITDASQVGLDVTGDMTVEGWINFETIPSVNGADEALLSKWAGGTDRQYLFRVLSASNKIQAVLSQDGTTSNQLTITGTTALSSTSTWYHIAYSVDVSASTGKVYLNGSNDTDTASVTGSFTSIRNGTAAFELSPNQISAYLDGLMDEVRVRPSLVNDDWIATEYNNQNSPSTFWIAGGVRRYYAPGIWR